MVRKNEKEWTTLSLPRALVRRLYALKVHRRETAYELIERLITELEEAADKIVEVESLKGGGKND
ncbi:MAG: hypothetical protein QW566_02510 [Candidatus Jordarchaeales archaeon]